MVQRRPETGKELCVQAVERIRKKVCFASMFEVFIVSFCFSLFYEPNDFYMKCTELSESENGGVSVARGWHVKSVDVLNKKVELEDGYEIQYDKCLIATG